MDAFTLRTTLYEMSNDLIDNRIEKITLPKQNKLILKIRNRQLLISIDPTLFRLHFTKNSFDAPLKPPMFTMLLRKYLLHGVITHVDMEGLERIVTFHITSKDEMLRKANYKLIVELMGKHSNVILTKEDNTIIDSIKRVPIGISRQRQVLPGLMYERPPKNHSENSLDNLTKDNIEETIGFTKFVKEQVLSGAITVDELLKSEKAPCPTLVMENEKPKYITTFNIEGGKNYNTMCELLDSFYGYKIDSNVQNTDIIRNLTTLLERDKRSKKIHEETLVKDEEKFKIKGELLNSFAYQIKKGDSKVTLQNYYTGEDIVIDIDKTLTPQQNAQKYYKKYNKIKSAKEHAKERLTLLSLRMEYLEESICFLHNASSFSELEQIKQELRDMGFIKQSKKKQKPKKLPPIKYECNGYTISVGRNSTQNDELTTKKAMAKDIWLHAKDIPGSHTVISTNGKSIEEIDEETLVMAAKIAAYHSKFKNSQNVPVDYTYIKHVKKPAHALPGKVIYTNQKTLFVTPDKDEIMEMKAK